MKEPKKIPLTDNPKHKQPNKIRLEAQSTTDFNIWSKSLDHEDNLENNSQSIQKLESDKTN